MVRGYLPVVFCQKLRNVIDKQNVVRYYKYNNFTYYFECLRHASSAGGE